MTDGYDCYQNASTERIVASSNGVCAGTSKDLAAAWHMIKSQWTFTTMSANTWP
jgi:hypothetical protein